MYCTLNASLQEKRSDVLLQVCEINALKKRTDYWEHKSFKKRLFIFVTFKQILSEGSEAEAKELVFEHLKL